MNTYRRVGVPTPFGIETFDIRISESGFADWLAQREQLREEGKPDRPPDVDTANLRAWMPHPGEEDHPYFVANPKPDPDDMRNRLADPTLTLSWAGVPHVRLFVLGLRDGGFEVRVQYDHEIVAGREYPKEMDPAAVWDDIETQFSQLNERFLEPPRVTTYTDFVLFDAEMELAAADIERGFISPIYTEGRVQ